MVPDLVKSGCCCQSLKTKVSPGFASFCEAYFELNVFHIVRLKVRKHHIHIVMSCVTVKKKKRTNGAGKRVLCCSSQVDHLEQLIQQHLSLLKEFVGQK